MNHHKNRIMCHKTPSKSWKTGSSNWILLSMNISLYIQPQKKTHWSHSKFQENTQTPIKSNKSPHKFNQILGKMEGKFHWDMKSKVISRTSSIGCSSHSIYYSGTAEGVPFKWETQPGTPKDPPPQDLLPPLSPPPAVLSLGVPKPCINQPKPRPRLRLRLRFWKRIMKSRDGRRAAEATTIEYSNGDPFCHNDKLETFSFLSSDCEFMASPRDSMSSSTTSSSSSSPSSFLDSLTVRNMGRVSFGRPSSCSAGQINKILACYHS